MSYIRELIDDGIVDHDNSQSVVKPYVMSHGTLECHSIVESRKFYEEFLGLECVQHAVSAMVIRCGVKFYIVCLQLGDSVRPCHVHNHWGVDVRSVAEVDAAYQAAIALKETYGFKQITEPVDRHGVYSFYFEDLNSCWWEIQYYKGFLNDDLFDFGDRFTPQGEQIRGSSASIKRSI